MQIVAERIKEIRSENKLSQAEFGKLFSVSQDTVSLWEKNKSMPGVEYVVAICKKFHISADYLLGLSEY